MICRNAFSISAENAYLCKRNRIDTLNKLSVSDGPGNKQSLRDGLFPIFELASQIIRTFDVCLSFLITGRWGR